MGAIRELGGRFLELNERTGVYQDIGDKKATEKTSQALREGQTKIRKQMYKEEEGSNSNTPKSAFDTSLLSGREISAEGYFGYSVQVLESLYNGASEAGDEVPPGQPPAVPPQPPAVAAAPVPSAMAMALDQFPGAAPPPAAPAGDIGRFTNSSMRITEMGGRGTRLTGLTDMSLFSLSSVRQLLESARNENYNGLPADVGGARGSIRSVLSSEIRDLIRLSEPQLIQVESMNIEGDAVPPSNNNKHEDKEVILKDADMEDRVSELRFTDVSRPSTWGKSEGPGAAGGGEPSPRLTDATTSTNYSKTSLMDASMMTIDADDMSMHSAKEEKKPTAAAAAEASPKKADGDDGKGTKRSNSGDLASAELLLKLSGDKDAVGNQAAV